MNLIVIDNFLPYPNVVRTWALSQRFFNCEEMTQHTGHPNTWPGLRTITVNELDTNYADIVLSRISHIAQTVFGVTANLSIRSSFQLTNEKDGDSWIHVDDDVDLAGLLYLTPNAPISAGTTTYTPPPHKEVDKIGNVYNRLVMYRATTYHKSSGYFGSTVNDGRLTQVFFVKGE